MRPAGQGLVQTFPPPPPHPCFSMTAAPSLPSRVLYGNKITEIPKELFSGLVSLQLL